MLEHVPKVVGEALRGIGPGLDKLTINASFAAAPGGIAVTSPDFADGAGLPRDSTEDGRKLSPALAWRGVPDGAAEVVLVIEDADSPTPEPLVHLIAPDLDPAAGRLTEGATGAETGRNSFLKQGWLPPDPPCGHGPHRYVFQAYALSVALALTEAPGRGALIDAMAGRVLTKGCLTGTYARP